MSLVNQRMNRAEMMQFRNETRTSLDQLTQQVTALVNNLTKEKPSSSEAMMSIEAYLVKWQTHPEVENKVFDEKPDSVLTKENDAADLPGEQHLVLVGIQDISKTEGLFKAKFEEESKRQEAVAFSVEASVIQDDDKNEQLAIVEKGIVQSLISYSFESLPLMIDDVGLAPFMHNLVKINFEELILYLFDPGGGVGNSDRIEPLMLVMQRSSVLNSMLEHDVDRLQDCRAILNFCPLGACVLAGTGHHIDMLMASAMLVERMGDDFLLNSNFGFFKFAPCQVLVVHCTFSIWYKALEHYLSCSWEMLISFLAYSHSLIKVSNLCISTFKILHLGCFYKEFRNSHAVTLTVPKAFVQFPECIRVMELDAASFLDKLGTVDQSYVPETLSILDNTKMQELDDTQAESAVVMFASFIEYIDNLMSSVLIELALLAASNRRNIAGCIDENKGRISFGIHYDVRLENFVWDPGLLYILEDKDVLKGKEMS